MIRTRRAHRKSRMGCFACKRRKAKCDEMKPSCTRCNSTLQECVYPPALLPATSKPSDTSPSLSPQQSRALSTPPTFSSFLESLPSLCTSNDSTPRYLNARSCPNSPGSALRLSDTDLFHHYLEHTSRTFPQCRTGQGPLQIGIPTLALKSKPVFYSILALSAVCLCCDMIYAEPPPSLDTVNRVLMTGYRHYNLASEQMRDLMSQSDVLKTEPLLASALLLVPFCTASQQVNHWISSNTMTEESHKPLSTTPRDIIVMMRGIRATLQALEDDDTNTSHSTESLVDPWSPSADFSISATIPPSRRHVMFAVIAATSEKAFGKLQKRIESLDMNDQVLACTAAFDVIQTMRADTFTQLNSSSPRSHTPEPTSLPQLNVRAWLLCVAESHASAQQTGPLTMRFLGFYAKAPQAYLDLVLPLLDQRLENPIESATGYRDSWMHLTRIQVLALDIYAHWSVFMILAEEESWWIGNLPIVTLSGMVNRYGDDFVSNFWPREESNSQNEHWWPGGMLNILREINRCR